MFLTNEEIVITKGKLLGTLTMPMEYEVSFKLYLNSILSINANVIHITNGVNCCSYGNRIATISFSNSLMAEIDAPVNGNGNYYFYSKPLSLQKWIKITIKQYLSDANYYYTVEIDGETSHFVKNTNPQVFQNVKLYVSDPWRAAQPGYIRKLFIRCQNIVNLCGLITTMSAKQNQNEINIRVNMKTDCACSIQNVSFYLQPEPKLIFRSFLWDGDFSLKDIVNQIDKFYAIKVNTLLITSYVTFSAVFFYKNLQNKNSNVSFIAHSNWIYNDKDSAFKGIQQRLSVLIEKVLTKIEPLWIYKGQNETFLPTEKFQFVCGSMHKRQQSPCYQREVSIGIVSFLPINVLDVKGYDSNNAFIYGRTHRNNIIEMDLIKRKPMIITRERCSQIAACEAFFK
ncbi:uncharacterized protein LOC124815249 isoform X2 [Hydra vulgaris]